MSCRHHLALEVSASGSISVAPAFRRVPGLRLDPEVASDDLETWSRDHDTCALAVAERGPHFLEYIAALFSLSRERVRQVESQVFDRIRTNDHLRSMAEDPTEHPVDPWDSVERLEPSDASELRSGIDRFIRTHTEFGAILLRKRNLTRKQKARLRISR